MAKSSSQITIVDITDGYTVGQTSESWTIPANLNSAATSGSTLITNVYAFCGSEIVSSDKISIDKNAIHAYTTDGARFKNSSNVEIEPFSYNPDQNDRTKLTISVATVSNFTLNTSGRIIVPIKVLYTDNSTELIFNCAISFSMAKTGATGAGAWHLSITAYPGTIIRNNAGTVTLTAHVFYGGSEKTGNQISGKLNWYKANGTTPLKASDGYQFPDQDHNTQLVIPASEVTSITAYTCELP